MMDEQDENGQQFRMRLDTEVDDTIIPTQVDELRIEKLSHRITLISILIPVLIVVILSMAYFDIKRRVIHTEDTGAVTAQHLSQDLESRFSSLSLSQAHLEEALTKLQDQTDQSLAKAQVNLKKLDDSLKQSRSTMASQKEVKSVSQKMDQDMANVAKSVEDLKLQVDALARTWESKLTQMDQQVSEHGAQMTQFKESLLNLEQNKIDKAAMDLAIKLEALKIKQVFNDQLEDVQAQIQSIGKKVDKLSSAQQAPAASSVPHKATTPKPPAETPQPERLQEQTISK
jgi:DNA repair exonuclease SbcCD ATPase subunit